MTDLEVMERDMRRILDVRAWPGPVLCMKKAPRIGLFKDLTFGHMKPEHVDNPAKIFDDSDKVIAEFKTVIHLLDAGWRVD